MSQDRLSSYLNGLSGVPLVGKGAKVAHLTINIFDQGGGNLGIGLEAHRLNDANINLLLDKVKAILVQKAGIDLTPLQPIDLSKPPEGK